MLASRILDTHESDSPQSPQSGKKTSRNKLNFHVKWLALLIPLAALMELLIYLGQLSPTMTKNDWRAVRSLVQKQRKSGDLIVFAPRWVRPLGRWHFGDKLMPIAQAAHPDRTRFTRILEVGWHGHHHPDTAGWPQTSQVQVGPFVVRTVTNPKPLPVLDDMLSHMSPGKVSIEWRAGPRTQPCMYRQSAPISSPYPDAPGAPAGRFACPQGKWVAPTVATDLDYRPRQCIYAMPPGGATVLRLVFRDVHFGGLVRGHHGIHVVGERDRIGKPVTIRFSSGGKQLGEIVHRDGDGWSMFDLPTPSLDGTTGDLVAEVSCAAPGRMYCFEATTR